MGKSKCLRPTERLTTQFCLKSMNRRNTTVGATTFSGNQDRYDPPFDFIEWGYMSETSCLTGT